MGGIAPFEPAIPAMVIGQSFDGAEPPLGLGEPFALLSGDRLGPDGIPFQLMHDHQPGFIAWAQRSCGALLAAERPWFRGLPLLLAGPPGAGRTHAARWLATIVGVPHVVLNPTDPVIANNIAASRGVDEALWASPVTVAMAANRCANPVVSVPGVDGLAADVAAGLAAMIDPATATAWSEDRLRTAVDLSEVTWVLQCQEPGAVPAELRRLTTLVELEAPPHSVDSVLALSILLEAMADCGVARDDPAFGWARVRAQLGNWHRPSAKALYAAMVEAITALQRGAAPEEVPF